MVFGIQNDADIPDTILVGEMFGAGDTILFRHTAKDVYMYSSGMSRRYGLYTEKGANGVDEVSEGSGRKALRDVCSKFPPSSYRIEKTRCDVCRWHLGFVAVIGCSLSVETL